MQISDDVYIVYNKRNILYVILKCFLYFNGRKNNCW